MPTIPTAPSAGPGQSRPTPLGLASAPFQAAADFFGEQAQALFEARAAEAVALRATQFATTQAEIVRSLNQRQVEALDLKDANTIRETTVANGQKDVEAILGSVQDKAVRSELDRVIPKLLMDHEFSALKIQRERQKDASLSGLPNLLSAHRDAISIAEKAGNDVAAEDQLSAGRLVIADNPYLTEVQKAQLIAEFEHDVDISRVDTLIEDNPVLLSALASDPEAFSVRFPGLDATERKTVRRSAETEIKRRETESNQARVDAERSNAVGMLDRIYNPENQKGFPTMADVFNARLSPTATAQFAEIVERQANGNGVNEIDHIMVNQLVKRIFDKNDPQHITDSSELLPWVGHGLPWQEFKRLESFIHAEQVPEEQAVAGLFKAFLDSAEGRISGSTLFGKDAKGEELFYGFRIQAQKLFDAGVEDGKSPHDLLDPTKPDYIGRIIPRFTRTPFQVSADMAEEFQPLETAVPESERWIPGETGEQYRERVK